MAPLMRPPKFPDIPVSLEGLNFEKIEWPQRIQRETARERKRRKIKRDIGLRGGESRESRAEP